MDGSVCISLNAEFFKKKYSLKQVTEEIRLEEKKENTPFIPRRHTHFRSIWHKKTKGLKKNQQENIKAELRSCILMNIR